MDAKVVVFIPARGYSSRIPRKNTVILGGKQLFTHAVEHARKAFMTDDAEIIVDSDDMAILREAEARGAIPLHRPDYFASNKATADELAFWEASQRPEADIYIQLMPTAPFIEPKTINLAANLLWVSPDVNSVVGTRQDVFYEWKAGRPAYFWPDGSIPSSQVKQPIMYEVGLYVTRMKWVLEHRKRADPLFCLPCPLSHVEAIDINWPEDLEFARIVWRGLNVQISS